MFSQHPSTDLLARGRNAGDEWHKCRANPEIVAAKNCFPIHARRMLMERICYTFELAPDEEAEYERRHKEMWPEMHAALQMAGFKSHSLFRRGRDVIAYAECEPTAAAAVAALEKMEVNVRWSGYMRSLMTRSVDSDGNFFIVDEIWHLD